jgi:hypothetical protein
VFEQNGVVMIDHQVLLRLLFGRTHLPVLQVSKRKCALRVGRNTRVDDVQSSESELSHADSPPVSPYWLHSFFNVIARSHSLGYKSSH